MTPGASTTIRILSAGSLKQGIGRCAETFARKTGMDVNVEFATAPAICKRVESGEANSDIVVVPVRHMELYLSSGQVVEDSPTPIGAVSAGVAVREGAPLPDLSSPDSLKQALLDADAVLYNTATSGQHIERLVAHLGIADTLAEKTEQFPDGTEVILRLASGTAEMEIGFAQVTEILRFERGVVLAGPLPEGIGRTTDYAAGLLVAATSGDHARALLDFMGSDEARRIYIESGLA